MDLPLSASVPTALARAQFLVLASVSVLVAMYAPALMVIRAIHAFPVAVRIWMSAKQIPTHAMAIARIQ